MCIVLGALSSGLFTVPLACAAEVDEIQETKLPPELEKTIELKKEGEVRVIPLVDITALGTYSNVSSSDDLAGVNIKGSIAPATRIDKKNYIIPLYYGSYDRERQVVVEEEGGRVYNEVMDHNATLEYKHILDENVTIKVNGLLRYHYVKEPGYDWSKGLYDYEDIGAGSTVEYEVPNTKAGKSTLAIGGEYYHRAYPNYASLISLATETAPEKDEKDYNGYRAILRYKYIGNRLQCAALYSPIFKDFDDKKIIRSDRYLTDDIRHDWFHYGRVELSHLPENSKVALGLRLTGILLDSNQNYNDSKNTIASDDDVFTSNYYSFKSLTTNPYLTYIHRVEDKKNPATVTLGYSYLIRDYDDRKAQNGDGSYKTDTQLDQTHTVSLQAVYPINEHLSALALAKYTKAASNMRYQTYYRYRYDSVYLAGGIRIKY